MNDAPRISVVLPTYNRLYCLPRAVNSVLRQTLGDLELIVVDDCSTDNTIEWLRTIDDPRLRIVLHETNKGAAGARNTGIARARAPIVAFQDSDDEWLVTKLERQVARLAEAGDDHAACYCGKIVYGRDDRFHVGPRLAAYMPDRRCRLREGDLAAAILEHPIISTQTLIVRREILDRVGGFDETLRVGEDWELTIRIARETRFAFIEEPLVMTFLMTDSITHRRLDGADTLARVIERNRDFFATRPAMLADKSFQIGRIYQRAGHWRAGMGHMWSAVRRRPGHARAWLGLALSGIRAPFGPDPRGRKP